MDAQTIFVVRDTSTGQLGIILLAAATASPTRLERIDSVVSCELMPTGAAQAVWFDGMAGATVDVAPL